MKRLPFIVSLTALIANLIFNFISTSHGEMGKVTDQYDVMFRPANYAFAIWGLIYTALAAWLIYRIIKPDNRLNSPAFLSSLISLLGLFWVWAFTSFHIILSMVIITLMLISLIIAYRKVRKTRSWIDRAPFSLYLGWICVATIANTTILLKDIGWHGGSLSESAWTVIMLSAGALLGLYFSLRFLDLIVPLVIAWAFIAIHFYLDAEDSAPGRLSLLLAILLVITALLARPLQNRLRLRA